MSDAELAAAIAVAKPAPSVPLPRLDREERATPPAASGPALAILAAPDRALSLTVHARDSLGFRPGLLAVRGAEAALLMNGRDGWRASAYANAGAAIDALAPELGLLDATPPGAPLSLDLYGFAALLAAADVLQRAELDARLDRRRLPEPDITVRDIERALAHGLATGDTRWAVCSARWSAPVSLKAARGKLKAGLAAIEGAGLDVARTLTDLRGGAGASALAWEGGQRKVREHALVLATGAGAWWVAWEGITTAPRAQLAPASAVDVRRKLAALLA